MNQHAHTNYHDYFQSGPWSQLLESMCLAGQSQVTLLKLRQPAGRFPDPPLAEFALQMNTAGTTRGNFSFGGQRFSGAFTPGSLLLAPRDCDTDYQLDNAFSPALLALPNTALQRFNAQFEGPELRDFGALHGRVFRDIGVEQILTNMFGQASIGDTTSALFVDSMVTGILALLHRHIEKRRQCGHKLDRETLLAITSLIEERLEENLKLGDLAGIAGMADGQFLGAFKASTGYTPYQYVLNRRIERARQMLSDGKTPLVDIAFACGFSSQQHLTSVFAKRVGLTPAQYRREVSQ